MEKKVFLLNEFSTYSWNHKVSLLFPLPLDWKKEECYYNDLLAEWVHVEIIATFSKTDFSFHRVADLRNLNFYFGCKYSVNYQHLNIMTYLGHGNHCKHY